MKISAQYIRPVNYTQNTKRTFTTQYGIQKKRSKTDTSSEKIYQGQGNSLKRCSLSLQKCKLIPQWEATIHLLGKIYNC